MIMKKRVRVFLLCADYTIECREGRVGLKEMCFVCVAHASICHILLWLYFLYTTLWFSKHL